MCDSKTGQVLPLPFRLRKPRGASGVSCDCSRDLQSLFGVHGVFKSYQVTLLSQLRDLFILPLINHQIQSITTER